MKNVLVSLLCVAMFTLGTISAIYVVIGLVRHNIDLGFSGGCLAILFYVAMFISLEVLD